MYLTIGAFPASEIMLAIYEKENEHPVATKNIQFDEIVSEVTGIITAVPEIREVVIFGPIQYTIKIKQMLTLNIPVYLATELEQKND